MINTNYQAVIHTIDSFPALPATATKVMQVTDDPESSAKDLMEAILPDQAMCLAILKVANSALFGQPKEVSSLERAVMVLGFNEIQSIVLGKAVFDSFRDIPAKPDELQQFWKHSFSCGVASKIIAQNLSLPMGSFFIAGLIHDIGKLALLITFPSDYTPKLWFTSQQVQLSNKAEKDTFAIGHTEAAARLLRKWFFPEQLISGIEFHHTPSLATNDPQYPLILFLSNIFTYYLEDPQSLGDATIAEQVFTIYPDFQNLWNRSKLPWQENMLIEWFEQFQEESETSDTLLSIIGS